MRIIMCFARIYEVLCGHRWTGCLILILISIFYVLTFMNFSENLVHEEMVKIHAKPSCNARKNFVFNRVHKSASSSLENIFFRYGRKYNLTFVLPATGIYIGHPEHFQRYMLPPTKNQGQEYNLLIHHFRLNYQEIRLLMPPQTLFLTMIRNPVDLFESIFHYVHLEEMYLVNLPVFIDIAPTYRHPFLEKRYGNFISGVNQISFDLGLNVSDFWTKEVVERFVYLLDDYFDLVMITERFEESLILLKDLLCLTFEEVVFFQLNKRPNESRTELSEMQRERLIAINGADQVIYDYFKKRFDERVEAYGRENMKKDVSFLRKLNKELKEYCVLGEREVGKYNEYGVEFFRPHLVYDVRQEEKCLRMVEGEGNITGFLKVKQKDIYL